MLHRFRYTINFLAVYVEKFRRKKSGKTDVPSVACLTLQFFGIIKRPWLKPYSTVIHTNYKICNYKISLGGRRVELDTAFFSLHMKNILLALS